VSITRCRFEIRGAIRQTIDRAGLRSFEVGNHDDFVGQQAARKSQLPAIRGQGKGEDAFTGLQIAKFFWFLSIDRQPDDLRRIRAAAQQAVFCPLFDAINRESRKSALSGAQSYSVLYKRRKKWNHRGTPIKEKR
jgi:hypothetical protein